MNLLKVVFNIVRRIIELEDRLENNSYMVEPRFVHAFLFVIPTDGFIRTIIRQFNIRASYSIRAWISKRPYDTELFYRFHPGTGMTSHMFYDINMAVPPTPIMQQTQRNLYSKITYTPQDVLFALEPGTYYYNLSNLESQENGYRLVFEE